MHSSISLLSLLALGSAAFPTLPGQGKSFRATVGHVNKGIPDKHDFLDFHIRSRAAGSTGRDSIIYSSYWFANITAGTTQNLTLLLDTGSAVTPNTSAQQNQGQLIYDPSKSKTAVKLAGETYNIWYGSGNQGLNGTVYTDQLCVGTACTTAPIGPASYMTGFTPGGVKSGIMGLSFGAASQYSPNKLPTFFEALQKSLALPVFTTNFRFDGTGWIDFGAVTSGIYTGSLQNVKIDNSTGAWNANNVAFYAGGKQLGTNITMNFDTGTPNIVVSNATIQSYFTQVPNGKYANGWWQFPCANASGLPDFSMRFASGVTGKIPGSQMLWGTLDGTNCVTWLYPTSGSTGFVGNAFFNANVVVFNQSIPALSFAPKSS